MREVGLLDVVGVYFWLVGRLLETGRVVIVTRMLGVNRYETVNHGYHSK